MPLARFIQHDGQVIESEVEVGESLMTAALSANVEGITGDCGGCASCATCHVYVAPEYFEKLDGLDTLEDELLEYSEVSRQSTSRLCCQILMSEELDGISLDVPEAPF